MACEGCGNVPIGMGVAHSNAQQKRDQVNELENLLERGAAIVRHCDVCLILDGNTSPKEVKYCKLCDKFMCEPCRKNPARRMAAAFAYHVTKFLRSFKSGETTV